MRGTLLAALAGTLLFSSPALARPHRHAHAPPRAPVVRVVIDPWAPHYRPAPRAGYVWVDGHYDRAGRWVPGYWVPAGARAGYVWVPGYWAGPTYVDGYWRPVARPGMVWVDGYYDERGVWHDGYWDSPSSAPPSSPPPASPPTSAPPAPPSDVEEEGEVHHDYE